ncbi:MAG: STAS domain-containing protein [Lachnospiraceae bacterium]|nr:STAS domain-containing protein [Lachnospiraceae bacterium]
MEETEVTITKTLENKKAILSVEGWLDTNSAPELGREIEALSDIESLILDFDKLEYISSAGLRILLSTQKTMNKKGSMVIKNVNEDVMDIFNITGFVDFLTIE